MLTPERPCDCGTALRDALITARDRISPEARERLSLLVDPYLPR
jgi:hypothetical protein